jgi:NAD(P)H dehydrogenase (quinone)
MYAVSGITGQVGSAVGRTLLAANKGVRAILRDPAKGDTWSELGCEVALADMTDGKALAQAFAGADGVFILLPPAFDPMPGFPNLHAILGALASALDASRPAKVVALSTIGAQTKKPNLLTQLTIMEASFSSLPLPVAFLRPAWFIENSKWDVTPARKAGVVPSFLQPLDRKVPMVATEDVGRVAAKLLQQDWSGRRVVELEGPRRLCPNDIAAAFSRILRREVRMESVPRETWFELFKAQGMTNPLPRIQMLDGFNEGWIEFEGGEASSVKGRIELETALRGVVEADLVTA